MKVNVIKESVGYSASVPELGLFAEGDSWDQMLQNLRSGYELTDEYHSRQSSPLNKTEFELVF